jgi:glucose-6-phosphate 1-epimerase
MNFPPSVSVTELKPGYPVIHVNHPSATGSVALLGAHVMEWTPAGQKPVLYMSADALFEEGSAIRGGIPVCWPWFGPKEGLPGHGLVRTRFWQLTEVLESADGVELVLTFATDEVTRKDWPQDFKLTLTVVMGAELYVTLRVQHMGHEAATYSGALHTYLTVGDINQTEVTGLEGTTYLDTLDAAKPKPQDGPVRFAEEVDRVYLSSGPVKVHDAAWNRVLEVSNTGSASAVVWNPWIEKSKRLNDLPDEAYLGFLCIEAANAGPDVITLESGQEHVLGTHVRVC